MKAIIVSDDHSFELRDVPVPEPAPGWARVKVTMAAFCATDLEVLSGTIPARYPITPGHEWCGVVDGVNGGDGTWVGKRVAGSNDVCCLTCDACRSGLWRNCAQFGEIGFAYNGAYAEYMLVPQYALCALPDNVSDAQAALLEPMGVALGTLEKASAALGDSLLIFGAGSIGLNMLAAARAAGLVNITVVERSGGRLALAEKLGADHVLASAKCDLDGELRRIYPHGPDITIDCTGSEECVRKAFSIAPKLGRVALAGYGHGRDMTVHIDDLHIKDLRVVGAGNNWNVIRKAILLASYGRINTECLATHFARLSDFGDVVALAKARPEGFAKAVFVL